MRRTILHAGVVALLTAGALLAAGRENLPALDHRRLLEQQPADRKVLYLTQSAGFRHDVLPLSEKILADVGRKHGFAVTVSRDASTITADSLKPYSAVVFYTTGELPMDGGQKAALLAWIRSGKGFVGIHSATDTFYRWPEYGEMIGGYFDEHPWNTRVTMKVEDHGHDSTKHLGPTWTLADEIYQFKNYSRSGKHVLLSLDVASVDLTAKGVERTDGDFANAWYKAYGAGRVFYTALGHRAEVWQAPAYQQHVAGGITWAMGAP